MKSVYCTVCSAAFLPRALALHKSLLKYNQRARFAYFCIDEPTARLLERLGPHGAMVVRDRDLADAALGRLRPSRSDAEYCWTLKPLALEYLARALPDADWLVYLDSDMLCFGDPDSALPGAEAHYLLTPHRYVPEMASYERSVGRYNAGYLAARRSVKGLEVLKWWHERCIESCSVATTARGYADQKYLDQIPGLFPFGEERAGEGLNVAPWNIGHCRVSADGGRVLVNDTPLLLYHFQGLRLLSDWLVDLYAGEWHVPGEVRDLIYRPYLEQLRAAYAELRGAAPAGAPGVEFALRGPRDWLRLAYWAMRGKYNLVPYRVAR